MNSVTLLRYLVQFSVVFTVGTCLQREFTAKEKETGIVEGEYLVLLKDGKTAENVLSVWGMNNIRKIKVGKKTVLAFNSEPFVTQTLANHPDVEYVEPNGLMHLIEPVEIKVADESVREIYDANVYDVREASSFREGCYNQSLVTDYNDYGTWGLIRTSYWLPPDYQKQPYLWSPKDDGTGVYAYIFDTGIELGHIEFEGRAYHGMYASEFADEGIPDYHGHGTHVASTVAGKVYGVAKNAALIDIKVLGGHGWGLLESNIEGLAWVAQDVIKKKNESKAAVKAVINMSLGYGWQSHIFHAAMQEVVDLGVTCVVAAGNNAEDATNLTPAGFDNTITVAATERENDAYAWFSSFGTIVDIAAPGVAITGAWSLRSDMCSGQTNYTCLVAVSGTSMASPHVAGVVARYMSSIPDNEFEKIDQEHVREMLIKTSSKDFISYQNHWQELTANRLLHMGCGHIPEDQTTTTTTTTTAPEPVDSSCELQGALLTIVLLQVLLQCIY